MPRRRKQSAAKPDAGPPAGSDEPEPETTLPKDETVAGNSTGVTALPPMARILSVVMLILGIIVVGALFFQVMAGFFVPLFLAALLVVIFRPVHKWFLRRTSFRRQIAAVATTTVILLVVLLPLVGVISVAASQFTSAIGQVQGEQLSTRLDEARQRFGLSLPEPEKFRRLDRLADHLDRPVYTDATDLSSAMLADVDEDQLLQRIGEARALVVYLADQLADADADADADAEAEADAETDTNFEPVDAPEAPRDPSTATEVVVDRLDAFAEAVRTRYYAAKRTPLDRVTAQDEYHRQSLIASAAIRSWINDSLGGTLQSQLKLLVNPSPEDFKGLLNRARQSIQPRFVSLTSRTGGFLIQFLIDAVVMMIAVYFFLIDGNRMTRTLMRLSPLDDEYEKKLIDEFDKTSRAVVLASVASAIVQGILAALAFWFFGLPSVMLLFLLTSLLALVPFLGAASVWVPCAVYLAAVEQRYAEAIILAIYGAGVVSSVDNVIKVYVLQGRSTLHPLFALLSVLGGVTVFGPIGIVVGPMVVVFLQTLLEILNDELTSRSSPGLKT